MKRAAKLALVLAAVAAGAAIVLVGARPEAYRSAGDLAADPAAFEGKAVQLKTTVRPGSLDRNATPLSFVVEDDAGALRVAWAGIAPPPEHEAGGSLDGRTVVLRGALVRDGEAWVFRATEMQVGCASKYEPR